MPVDCVCFAWNTDCGKNAWQALRVNFACFGLNKKMGMHFSILVRQKLEQQKENDQPYKL